MKDTKSVFLLQIAVSVATLLLSLVNATYDQDVICTIRPNQTDTALQDVLSYACSQIDCSPIQPNGRHFLPNILQAHTAWAVGQYYQLFNQSLMSTCDFNRVAMLQCPQNNATGLTTPRILGVNIGGFLVLEAWITPSLFEQFVNKPMNETAIDEYTFCAVLGTKEATKQLTKHWETWVTEKDISQIAALGITHIRIPFGYWIFGDAPPFIRGIEQLDRVLDLAAKYKLQVLLDVHGALGSQNGFDNSGRACDIKHPTKKCFIPTCPKEPLWGKDQNLSTVNQTLHFIDRIVSRYQNHSAVWGFELVNEPRLINMSVLRHFYQAGYEVVRRKAPHWYVVIHDGFYPLQWWNFMTPRHGFEKVILDTHIYEAFGGDNQESYATHLVEACGYTMNIDYMECNELPLIVGEWSLGSEDCPKWLDGFGQHPTSKKCPNRPPNTPRNATFLSAYGRRQLSAFYRGHGYFFWNFKTETAKSWNFLVASQEGWLPSFTLSKENIELCGYSVLP